VHPERNEQPASDPCDVCGGAGTRLDRPHAVLYDPVSRTVHLEEDDGTCFFCGGAGRVAV